MPILKGYPLITRLTISLIPPTTIYYLYHLLRGTKPSESINNSLEAFCKVVGLYGLSKTYEEMAATVGVELTIPRTCQVLCTIGSFFSTLHYWTASYTTSTARKWGRLFLSLSVVYTLTFIRMLYLTFVYNRRLECMTQPVSRSIRGDLSNTMGKAVHAPYLGVWIGLVYFSLYMWVREARDLANEKGVLSMSGFVLGIVGGFQVAAHAITTSYPAIRPLEGVTALIAGSILGGLQWLPYWNHSPKSRVYLAGFSTILFALFVNAGVIRRRAGIKRIK